MSKTTVEIIIPVWLRNDDIKLMTARCLGSLKKNTQYKHKLQILYNDGTGVTRHWNAGIKSSRADVILLANNDLEFFPGWLTCLVKELEKNKDIAFISPQIVENEKQIEQIQRNCGKYGTMPGITGCCFAFRRETIDKLGMFDESMKVYYSDHDMWNRVKKMKLENKIARGSFINHIGHQTVDSLNNGVKEADYAVYQQKWGK